MAGHPRLVLGILALELYYFRWLWLNLFGVVFPRERRLWREHYYNIDYNNSNNIICLIDVWRTTEVQYTF